MKEYIYIYISYCRVSDFLLPRSCSLDAQRRTILEDGTMTFYIGIYVYMRVWTPVLPHGESTFYFSQTITILLGGKTYSSFRFIFFSFLSAKVITLNSRQPLTSATA